MNTPMTRMNLRTTGLVEHTFPLIINDDGFANNDDTLYYRLSNALPLDEWHSSSAFVPSLPLPPTPESVRDVRIVVKSLPGAGPRLSGGLGSLFLIRRL